MILAYAKINLGLYVVARRADGYHDIETVFCRIGIADGITLSSAHGISVTSSSRDAPSDESNICHKAAQMLQDHLHATEGVHIHIQKNVPVGAGLGGGSADAAAVLMNLPAFWHQHLEPDECLCIARALGSDVPYFLQQGAALGRGRGEQLEYFPLDLPFTVLLCNPNINIPTAWAYAQITPGLPGKPDDLRAVVTAGMRDPGILRQQLRNDFERVVLKAHPEVQKIKELMLAQSAVFALMSGSGSTVFGFFTDPPAAESVAREFADRGYWTFITPPHFKG
jgi:4-diphosphocytidyl-2-C-methyl-D-erythritol kinase